MVALPDPQTAGEVVHPQRAAEHRRQATIDATSTGEDRHEKREHPHEVRRILEHPLPFGESFVDQAELALVEVTEPTMHEFRAPRAGPGREVVSFDERGAEATTGGIERDARAGDPATHYEEVEVAVAAAGATRRRARSADDRQPAPLQATGHSRANLRVRGADRQVRSSAPTKTAATPIAIDECSGSTSSASVPAVSRWTVTTAKST